MCSVYKLYANSIVLSVRSVRIKYGDAFGFFCVQCALLSVRGAHEIMCQIYARLIEVVVAESVRCIAT